MGKICVTFLLFFASTALAQDAAAKRPETVTSSDADMQRAIQFERTKDRQDALQARKERVHPSNYDYSADRKDETFSTVKDPGAGKPQKDKI